MAKPMDTLITIPNAAMELIKGKGKELFGVRIYKDTPDTVLLQIFGKRANTRMYGMARMNKNELRELIKSATELLDFLPDTEKAIEVQVECR